jgi:hypothetical protein
MRFIRATWNGSPPASGKKIRSRDPDRSWRAPAHAASTAGATAENGAPSSRSQTAWAFSGAVHPSPRQASQEQKAPRPAGTSASHRTSRVGRGWARRCRRTSATSRTIPALRVPAASAPSTPAHAHCSRRAASTAPTESRRKSASAYTAEWKNAMGNSAVSQTAWRAGPGPSSSSARRRRR